MITKDIAFIKELKTAYVNLTNMARATSKKVNDWLRLNGSKDYVEEVSRSTGIPVNQLVVKAWDEEKKCTTSWAHKLIALAFAKWISSSFAVWCNQHLLEIIETGTTIIDQEVVAIQHESPDFSFYLQKLIELKPLLEKDKELAKQMFKHIYDNL